jgi:hypothetical protein
LLAVIVCACTPSLDLANVHEGDYGVICQGPDGLSGVRLEFHPVNHSPGVDLLVCDGACIRPRMVAITLSGDDLTFDTRDAWPPQDGVSVAPERHWTAAFETDLVHLEGQGDGYRLASMALAKDAVCPAGTTEVTPKVELAP